MRCRTTGYVPNVGRAKTILNPCDHAAQVGSQRLKGCLEQIYSRYNRRELIAPDPLQFVYRYAHTADKEIAGFLAAVLAYGRVRQIEKSVDRLLGLMGPHPAVFVRNFDLRKRAVFADFRHRFTSGDDICDLLFLLKKVLLEYGGLEAYFARGIRSDHQNVIGALSAFCDSLLAEHARRNRGSVRTGLKYLLSSPTRKSACKRLNLFLRWMVRDDAVDAGVWKSVAPAMLLVPLDVHMSRISLLLNLCEPQNVSIKTAVEVTQGFARIHPTDPVRYDFALCRAGMENDNITRYMLKTTCDGTN
ncbi:MAG: TIGR02757 family protein [Phycisphaerae bacterium]|nr:TIGR02757 family protein [Phycisphaerae bacterium]